MPEELGPRDISQGNVVSFVCPTCGYREGVPVWTTDGYGFDVYLTECLCCGTLSA